jgi:hypothetical protein
VAELGENGSRRFCSPARYAGVAVCRVADQHQVIGNRRWPRAELLDNGCFVERNPRSTVQPNDTRSPHALGEILVWRTNDYPFNTGIPSRSYGARGERVIRLELDHGPDYDAGRGEGFLEQVELGQEIGFYCFAGLVAWPQSIAEGLDDVIGCSGQVGGAVADHTQNRREHASHRRNLATVLIPRGL